MTYNQLMAAAEAHSLGQLLKCIQKKVCSNQHTGLGQMSYLLLYHKIFFSSLLVPYYKIENILQYITRKKDKIGQGCLYVDTSALFFQDKLLKFYVFDLDSTALTSKAYVGMLCVSSRGPSTYLADATVT